MPRIPRGQQAGFVYHVINRGNGRATIFHKAQDYFGLRRFQTFQKPALSLSKGSIAALRSSRGISPFEPFQSFNRFAPFKTFQAMEVPNGPKVSVVPIAALESHKQTTANVNLGWVLTSSLGQTETTNPVESSGAVRTVATRGSRAPQ